MSEYDSAVNLAERLIIKKGREVVYVRKVVDTVAVNPDEPWNKPRPLEKEYKTRIVFLDYDSKFIDGTTIMQGDKKGLMFAKGLDFTPTEKDIVVEKARGSNGVVWNVMDHSVLQPGDVPVLYTLQLRK